MFLIHLLYALFIGLGIAWLFGLALGTRGPWNSFIWFFLVIFLFSWGGGVWLTPFGPTGWGVSWLPFLFVGFFVTLLLLAATPRSARGRRALNARDATAANLKERVADEKETESAVDVFFWVLIVFLAAVIFCSYMWHPYHL